MSTIIKEHTRANCVAIQAHNTQASQVSALTQPILLEPTANAFTLKELKLDSVQNIYPRCLYHEPIIQLVQFPSNSTRGYFGMDRYLREESEQQYAVFLRPDDGLLSLDKNCTCGYNPKKDASKL